MYVTSTELAAELRTGSHQPVSRLVALWPDRSEREVWEGTDTRIILSGSVTADRKREIRRQASFELANPTGSLSPRSLGDLFFTGSLVKLERGCLLGGTPFYVPLATLDVLDARPGMDGRLTVTANGLIGRAQQQFGEAVTLDGEMLVGEAIYLVLSPVLGTDLAYYSFDDGGRTLGVSRACAEDDERLAVAMSIARDAGCELYDYRNGEVILRPVTDPTTQVVARAYLQEPGVAAMLTLERAVSATPYNRAIVVGQPLDGPVVRGVAEVTDPTSPLHSSTIGLRQAPIRRTAQITRQDVANDAAMSDLIAAALVQEAVGGAAIPDPLLDERDLVSFTEAISGTDADYVLGSVTIPLVTGSMPLAGVRSYSLFAA